MIVHNNYSLIEGVSSFVYLRALLANSFLCNIPSYTVIQPNYAGYSTLF